MRQPNRAGTSGCGLCRGCGGGAGRDRRDREPTTAGSSDANMGAASRRPEVASVAEALARYRPLKFLTAPATLDGGDVLRIGRSVFVGLSRRTNRHGLEQFSDLVRPHGYQVQPVVVTGCLHLKSACSYVGNNTILVNRSWIDVEPLRGFELLDIHGEEPAAANALLLNDAIVIPHSFPKTCALLKERGFRVRTVDVSELQKAEAGVTCCSLIFQANPNVEERNSKQ